MVAQQEKNSNMRSVGCARATEHPTIRNTGVKEYLKWEMMENDVEKYPMHSSKVFTAFAYEHNGQPFLRRIEVTRKLR